MLVNRTTKLKLRRKFKRSRLQVEEVGVQAEEHFDKHFIGRLNRLMGVRRFIFGWLLLIALMATGVIIQIRSLGKYYLKLRPDTGGIYTEGILGTFTNANPIYATGSVDTSASRLIFSGLLKYDQKNHLIGDLASSWTVDERETTYTVKLKPNLKWQDGQTLTAEDIVFTYKIIQNPDAKSPLFYSWQGITVSSPDPSTITFKLQSPLSSFLTFLTNGIVPKHLLDKTAVSELRSSSFNTVKPVGSGPFVWNSIDVIGNEAADREQQIGFEPNPHYYFGQPKLAHFILHTFPSDKKLIESFLHKQIQAVAGLSVLPDEIKNQSDVIENSVSLTGAVYAFFKTSLEPLNDVVVRKALVESADNRALVKSLNFPAITANGPLLKGQIGYNPKITQLGFNQDEANTLLDQAGWIRSEPGSLRKKNNKVLSLRLVSKNSPEYTAVAGQLQMLWRQVGVDLQVVLQTPEDIQGTISNHDYDILLYGISLGSDPDVYAYWHSSQADIKSANRLNFSEYKSTNADHSLEAGRTRSDPALRTIKYQPFLESWRNDAPALAIYQPRFLYIVRSPLYNFDSTIINSGADRYSNVHNWMIRETRSSQ